MSGSNLSHRHLLPLRTESHSSAADLMFQQGFEKLQTGGEGGMETRGGVMKLRAGFHLGSSEQSCPSLRHLADMHQGSPGYAA